MRPALADRRESLAPSTRRTATSPTANRRVSAAHLPHHPLVPFGVSNSSQGGEGQAVPGRTECGVLVVPRMGYTRTRDDADGRTAGRVRFGGVLDQASQGRRPKPWLAAKARPRTPGGAVCRARHLGVRGRCSGRLMRHPRVPSRVSPSWTPPKEPK